MHELKMGSDLTIEEALRNAARAAEEDLRGVYPMAARVLAAEIKRLRGGLFVIAYPRRGTTEAQMTIDEISQYAATFIARTEEC